MKFDTYSLKARLAPVCLLLLPILLAVAALQPFELSVLNSLVTFALYCGLCYFFAELGRDQGKRKEIALFKSWDGKPTTRFLRHRDATLDPVTKNRYHKFLSDAVEKRFPSALEELSNPAAADETYQSAGKLLLEKTRDTKEFPLLLKENISYGFRRNLWGMKPAGILVCLLALAASLFPICQSVLLNKLLPVISTSMALFILLMLTLWLLRITPAWVRLPAEAYAQRLLAACDVLPRATEKSNLIC